MGCEQTVTVSARVNPRTRRLAETAAELQGVTLSRFVALAVQEFARQELATDSSILERREQADE
jgi:uncharacterized protein (DUF1778 family)